MKQINFFCENISFTLKNKAKIKAWIAKIVLQYEYKLSTINYIFCSDEGLREVNKQYLNHDYYTDIITFDQADDEHTVAGDLYISIDRIVDNAKELGITFEQELHRVLIHGVLHLLGYDDLTDDGEAEMRQKEDEALALLLS
jgi:probable rRNA maturation factor